MSRPIFAANWKMHHGPTEAKAFLRTFLAHYARRPDRDVILFPCAATLTTVARALDERPDIRVGAQNIHWEDRGAFTGEISAPIARDAGARLTLVGHSERRHVFGETDAQTSLKCVAAFRSGLVPMLCVGETLDERERGATEQVVLRQLRAGLVTLQPAEIGQMMIAYEPVWAIGTGRTATTTDASAVHAIIRSALGELGGNHGARPPILYGGSVNLQNVEGLLAADGVDGVLVGGASLDADAWSRIVRS